MEELQVQQLNQVMALTGAERQRRHREKLRAEGRLPKPRRTPTSTSSGKTLGWKSQEAANKQPRGHQFHSPPGQDLLLGAPIPAEAGIAEQTPLMVVKAEPDAVPESNDDIALEHELDADQIILKHGPEMQSEFAGMLAGETSDAFHRDCQEATQEVAMGWSGGRTSEQVTQENLSLPPRPEGRDGHDETRDSEAALSTRAVASYVYEAGDGAGSSLEYEAFLEQQKILRRRWLAAERQRKRRSRLRAEGKYQNYRQKHNVISGRNRAKQKDLEKTLPDDIRRECLAKRREDTRRRVARYRERKKWMLAKDELQSLVPAEISLEELAACHQDGSAKRDLLYQPNSSLALQQGAEDRIPARSLPARSSRVLPYSLQRVDCHQSIITTTTSTSTSGDPRLHEEPDSAREEALNLHVNDGRDRPDEETLASAGPVTDHQAPQCYITPPVWPCNGPFQIRQGPFGVAHVLPDESGERQATRQELNSQECPKDGTSVRVRDSLTHLQTRPSQSLADMSRSDSVRIELVTEFDQDHPCRTDGYLRSVDWADMPDDLRNELYALRHQLPLVHNYIKKLQTDVMNLQAKNQQLRKRTLCLDEIKANSSMFHFWSGFPSYESFRHLFEALKAVVEPATCPHATLAPTLEEEFFYVLVRLRVGLFMKDIASRIGISEADYALIFHRWITALLRHLRDVFRSEDDERSRPWCPTIQRVTSSTDCTNVLIDCGGLLSEEATSNWRDSQMQVTDRSKFVMGVSFPTGTVIHISDVPAGGDNGNSPSVVVKLNHLHSSIVGLPEGLRLPIGDGGIGLIQAHSDCLVKIVNRIRSFHILDNYQMKLQCETFRAVFKVCALLSNVMK